MTPARFKQKATEPVTLATYQILTYRASQDDDFVHLGLFDQQAWGLIITEQGYRYHIQFWEV